MTKKIITNDEYYKHLENNPELLKKAGWFNDEQSLDTRLNNYNLNIQCTPIFKLKTPQSNRPIVLLTTGGFSPMHLGHFNLINEARIQLENKEFDVVGGFISPSHDNYVLNKHDKTFNIEKRIESIEKIIFESAFLSICPWEAVYNNCSINFTDVINRLQLYLRKYYHPNTEVCYVFGSDNQYFIQAFKNKGMCFCLKRNEALLKCNKNLINNKTIFFSKENNYTELMSRNINYDLNQKNGVYLLRNDINESCSKKIIPLFSKYFKNVKILPKEYNQIKTKYKSISLDVHFKGDFNLSITRLFNFGNNFKSNKLISRNNITIENQINSIPKGTYTLIDDDISSGFTINYIKELLKNNNIIIKEEISLMHTLIKEPILDVVDLRDFIFGEDWGGLTIELPNKKIARIPYILPLIDLNFRASFSYLEGIEFSKEIIKINKEIHAKTIVKDLPVQQRELFYYYKFKDEELLINTLDYIFPLN